MTTLISSNWMPLVNSPSVSLPMPLCIGRLSCSSATVTTATAEASSVLPPAANTPTRNVVMAAIAVVRPMTLCMRAVTM